MGWERKSITWNEREKIWKEGGTKEQISSLTPTFIDRKPQDRKPQGEIKNKYGKAISEIRKGKRG